MATKPRSYGSSSIWPLRSDVDRVLARIVDDSPAPVRHEVVYWCDCKEANEIHTGMPVGQYRAGGPDHEAHYAAVPTVQRDGFCVYCGYAAVAKRLPPNQYQAVLKGDGLKRTGKNNKNRCRKILQFDAKTGKLLQSFESSEEAIKAGIKSVRYAVRTGKVLHGRVYKYADGKKAMVYGGARTGRRASPNRLP